METINKRVILYQRKSYISTALKLFRWRNLPKIDRQVTYINVKDLSINAATLFNDEEKIGIRLYRIAPSKTFNSTFLRTTSGGVIALYKDTGKMFTINHRQVISELLGSKERLKLIGMEWAHGVPSFIFTKPILKAILKGLCTNRDDAVRRYYNSVGVKGMNYKTLMLFHDKVEARIYEGFYRVATNMENLIKYKKNEHNYDTNIVRDLVELSQMLDKKVNFNWSKKRMKLEHDELSKEVTMILMKHQEHKEVGYEEIAPVPELENLTVLESNSELLQESIMLNHCVGTSPHYFEGILALNKLILHYERGDSVGTAELNLYGENSSSISLAQFNGRGNSYMSSEDRTFLMENIERPEFKEFVDNIIKTRKERQEAGTLHEPIDEGLPF